MNSTEILYKDMADGLIIEITEIFDRPVMDVDIENIMRKLGDTLGADRSYIFMLKSNGNKLKKRIENLYEWCAEGIEPDCNIMQDVDSSELPWWINKLSYNETINCPDTRRMPTEAEIERSIFESQNVRSILAVPIMSVGDVLLGFLALDTILNKREWGPREEGVLRQVANMFKDYLEKRRAEIEMRRATRILDCRWKSR